MRVRLFLVVFAVVFFVIPLFTRAESNVVVLEQVKLNFKENMIAKGFFFDFPQNDFTFIIRPNGLKRPTLVDAKKIAGEGVVFPDGFELSSGRIYEYEIHDPMAFNHKVALEFAFRGQDFSNVTLYYWDFSQNAWLPFPEDNQTLGEDGVFRGIAYATKLRMAPLHDNSRNVGEASWYAYKDCDCAASPFYPKGTKLLVTHLYNQKQVVVMVNDFGPDRSVFPNRVIDLDLVAFEKIANPRVGVIDVRVDVVSDDFVLSPEGDSSDE